jgi:hypothetical protein
MPGLTDIAKPLPNKMKQHASTGVRINPQIIMSPPSSSHTTHTVI